MIQKMTLLPILMNSRYLTTTLVHGTTLYNLLPVCVDPHLIFQWLNFGQFALLKQCINFPNYGIAETTDHHSKAVSLLSS